MRRVRCPAIGYAVWIQEKIFTSVGLGLSNYRQADEPVLLHQWLMGFTGSQCLEDETEWDPLGGTKQTVDVWREVPATACDSRVMWIKWGVESHIVCWRKGRIKIH